MCCKSDVQFGYTHVCVLLPEQRMALDQFGFAPLFIPVFMSSCTILEGKASEIPDRLRASWAGAVTSNWALWIPAQLLNFKFIPPVYQVKFLP